MSDAPDAEITLTAEQMACLASPLRAALLDRLIMDGPASVGELTVHLDAAPKTLYYHLRQMQQAGLVQVAEMRRGSRREETVYRATATRLRVDASRGPEHRAHMARSVSALLRLIDREHQQFLKASAGMPQPVVGAMVQRLVVNLTPEQLSAFFELLQQAARYARDNSAPQEGADGHRIAISLFAIPHASEEPS